LWRGRRRELEREFEAHLAGESPEVPASPFSPAEGKPDITPAELDHADIPGGSIRRGEGVAGSSKLIPPLGDFGSFTRTILAGMKRERKDPHAVEGCQALFVVNLAPKEMAGETSQGMLLDIGYADGLKPVLAIPETPVPDGARAG